MDSMYLDEFSNEHQMMDNGVDGDHLSNMYSYEDDDHYYRQHTYNTYQDSDMSYYDVSHGDSSYYDYNSYDYDDASDTVSELIDNCVIPTMSQAVYTLYPLLGLCVLSRVISYLAIELFRGLRGWAKPVIHLTHTACGVASLYLFFEETLIYPVMISLLTYVLLLASVYTCRPWCGITVACTVVVYLVTCEVFVVDGVDWHRIRGAQMVLSMKIISLGFDLGAPGTTLQLPSVLEYGGYVFHEGSVIFGPWTSYSDYCCSLTYKDRKMDFYWIAKCAKCCMLSVICLFISTCSLHWIVTEEDSSIWIVSYRDAMSFRFSHYFISYLSELTMTLSGSGATKSSTGEVKWDVVISRPFHIETPRSLVEVVINWNIPMHQWLKTYVFKTAKPLGNFAAILLTYSASALLHGLNFQLAAVLLSLGIYSYIEYVFRNRLSRIFDACLQARPCRSECSHTYKYNEYSVRFANVGLGVVAAFHLAYLGLMFDSSYNEEQGYSMQHTLSKWSVLGYSSHWVAFTTYFYYLLI